MPDKSLQTNILSSQHGISVKSQLDTNISHKSVHSVVPLYICHTQAKYILSTMMETLKIMQNIEYKIY